eukprot:TRINITY_DN5799_c3_g1_i1.p1 TRINITY_DN5799_c3_g1~~TRINITY_DN5799_c3_g1_i1.p1  ORF type:complete len:362 (+),score=61.50 TRINITY_DN5799_c3_g1_i1:65-1150(+)
MTCRPAGMATPVRQSKNIEDMYELGEECGSGKTSRVLNAVCKSNGKPRAIKVMNTEGMSTRELEMLQQEKEIMRRMNHDKIVTLYEVVETQGQTYLIMEKMNGDLYDYVDTVRKQTKAGLPERDARLIMRQLLEGVMFMHDQGVVHRDLKPENILINDPSDIKIADFGVSKVADTQRTPVGTSFYMAPEIIRAIELLGQNPARIRTVDQAMYTDMWALGCVLHVMLCGRPPFFGSVGDHAKRINLLRQIDKGVLFPDNKWKDISDEAKDLISSLLTQQTKRLSAKQAIHHVWFTKDSGSEGAELGDVPNSETRGGFATDMSAICNEMSKIILNDDSELIEEALPTNVKYGAKGLKLRPVKR